MSSLHLGKSKWWGIDCPINLKIACAIQANLSRILAPFGFLSVVAFTFANYNNLTFDTLGIIFSVMPVGLVINIKLICADFKSYESLMLKFMNEIHLHSYYLRDKDTFIKSTLIKVEKYTRRTFLFLLFFIMIDWFSWAIMPIVYNYRNRQYIQNRTMRLQTCLYLWTPFDYAYNFRNWVLVHSFNSYMSFAGCVLIGVFDTTNFAFFFNLLGHMDILLHLIKTRLNVKKMTDANIKKQLVEIVKYHTFITKTFVEVQSAFGINVTGNYLQNLLEDSLLLYYMMFGDKGQKVTYGLMMIIYLGGVVLISFVLEEVRKKSDKLSLELYCTPWEDMSVSNQKMFRLILLKVQPTLSFKAAGGLEAGVTPMLQIIKSTFSYYLILKSSVE